MPWYRGIAPAYLNVFIWAPFFDQLWVGRQALSGTPWLVADAFLGSVICFGLYLAAASWGLGARKPLCVMASSTFGATGSEWLCGVAVAIAGVAWYAIAINFGVDSTLLGLRACGLIPASGVAAWRSGPFLCKSPVFLGTALFWVYITRTAIMMRLSGVVVALMKVYAPIALLLLTATALWGIPASWARADASANISSGLTSAPIQIHAGDAAITMIVSYFALSALLSVDWGAAAGTRGDILRAGLPCVLGAAAWTSIMSLVVVNNTANLVGTDGLSLRNSPVDPLPMSFRWAVFRGAEMFPPNASAAILILFGLAALAPAVSALAKYSEGMSTHWTRLRPGLATWIACPIAFILIATFQVDRLGPVYRAMGVFFLPVLGAMAGDLLGRNQVRIAFRTGINPAGCCAWAAGCSVAAALELTTTIQPEVIAGLQPGSICGFIVAAFLYLLLSRLGFELAPLLIPSSASDSTSGSGGAGE
jgi:cytosine permease